jgi:hypothetical protein
LTDHGYSFYASALQLLDETRRGRIDQRTLLAGGWPVNDRTVLGDYEFEEVQPVADLLQVRDSRPVTRRSRRPEARKSSSAAIVGLSTRPWWAIVPS